MNPSRWAWALGASLSLAFFTPACSGGDDDVGPDGTDAPDGADNGGAGGSGNDGNDADGGGAGGEASGGSGTGGGGVLPTSCDEIQCIRGVCDDSTGVAVCECDDGFEGPDCLDINETTNGTSCGPGMPSPVNTWGSYYCDCPVGYSFNGTVCADVNECGASPCASGASCSNQDGGYQCSCSGNFGNGWACGTPNHCAGSPCGAGAACVSTASGAACQCPLGSGGDGNCNLACDSLDIDDPALVDAIEELIGKPIGQIDPAVDLVGETALSLSGRAVYSLDGLECWPTLEELDLTNTPLGLPNSNPTDTTPIAALGSLHRLRSLDLSCTPLSSLDVLTDHPTLTRLAIDQRDCTSNWSDLSALSSLDQLEYLDLIALGFSSLPEVAGLKALREVNVAQNELTSVAPFTSSPLLESLVLLGNQIADASALASATSLRELDLSYNQVASAAFLTSLTKLEGVWLIQNELGALPSLAPLTQLQQLNAADNELTSAANVAANAHLKWVTLSVNDIDDAEPFLGTGFKGDLDLSANPVCTSQADVFADLAKQGVRVNCNP